MRNKNILWSVCALCGIAVLYQLDQLTKQLCNTRLNGADPIELIPGVLELRYLENRGAAFGILQNQQWLFTILTLLFFAVIIYAFIRTPKNSYYAPMLIADIFLTAGAAGNFYDRQINHYVIDFIYFKLINFPIFNVADIYVTCSVIVICLLFLCHYKDTDFDYLTQTCRKKE